MTSGGGIKVARLLPLVLFFNFSVIDVGDNVKEIERSFRRHCNSTLSLLRTEYAALLAEMPEMPLDAPVSDNLNITRFALQAEDTAQIQGYAQGLRQEYPEAQIALFVIYCFGNQGFRVFAL